jgi:protein-tyrosine-phosphatase
LKEFGVRKVDAHSKKVKKKDIEKADLIIVVADDIDLKVKGKRVMRWKIPDVDQGNYSGILDRTERIEKRIKNLISMLK